MERIRERIVLPPELADAVEGYRQTVGLETRQAAVRVLLKQALAAHAGDPQLVAIQAEALTTARHWWFDRIRQKSAEIVQEMQDTLRG